MLSTRNEIVLSITPHLCLERKVHVKSTVEQDSVLRPWQRFGTRYPMALFVLFPAPARTRLIWTNFLALPANGGWEDCRQVQRIHHGHSQLLSFQQLSCQIFALLYRSLFPTRQQTIAVKRILFFHLW